jgi:DNA repair exonuclease SbcCD ATPase subunit|tara:strand:- start:1296 stop:3005 length:1710 start_codon:yes stop_codon:yes gene_type:complete
MINFNCVRWKNFLSTGNTFTEIPLDKNATTLIVGENGAGKSTILDALCFSLFGKPFRVISKSQLVNSINDRETVVEVEFSIGTKEWKIIRGIRPNIFEIYCDSILVNQDANSRDYQKFLEQNVLRLNYRSFTQVVILGSSTFVPFMQLKASHRREVVEEILDIKIFSIMGMLLKQKIKDLTDEIKELDYQFELAVEKISMQQNYIDDMKANKEQIILEKQMTHKNNKSVLDERTEEFDFIGEENIDLMKQTDDHDTIKGKLQKFNNLRATLIEKHKQLTKDAEFFKNNENCPTCLQDIESSHKQSMLHDKEDKIKNIVDGATKLKDELKDVEVRLDEINDILTKVRENEVRRAELSSSITELEKYNQKLDDEISSFESGSVSETDIDKLSNMKNECKGVENTRSTKKEERVYVHAARDMLDDAGIKTKIIKQYLPIMNQLINKYLMSMEFYVNFNLDENFNETIRSRFRDAFNYASFSEGEKMRIDLALLFTWRAIAKMKNSTNTNLLILDEIFDSSLDGQGTDEFLRILNTLDNENVFVISHKGDQLADKFRNSIRFEKIQNFSRIAS